MESIKEWLKGKKTYVVGVALICYAVGGFIAQKVEVNEAIQAILLALGLMGLRNGMSSK